MVINKVYIGIDVGKHSLDLAWPDGKSQEVPNTSKGVKSLLRKVQRSWPEAILCLEATGGYERTLTALATVHEVPVALANPKRVRDYARSKGILAKTDKIDARVIRDFGQDNLPRLLKASPSWAKELNELVQRRDSMVSMRSNEKNRLDPKPEAYTLKSIQQHIRFLDRAIAQIEEAIDQTVAEYPELKLAVNRLCQVKAIGPITAKALLAAVPELGSYTDREITALTGLAPFNHDSGTHRGRRRIFGGRAEARKAVYMAAVVASQHNPILRDFYQRLLANGKPKKLALTAVMRKLMILANRIMSDPEFNPA